ncbi:unnamed protein product [Prorocentrum cordatum]|uniref:IPT/TIG domain-containing protein n=1 Tax=Prorocentrum cordatum TaxID=2364126 RepID=A0ABN9W867_9DINO|nr:unnamed protein product [Polarella glacialis]
MEPLGPPLLVRVSVVDRRGKQPGQACRDLRLRALGCTRLGQLRELVRMKLAMPSEAPPGAPPPRAPRTAPARAAGGVAARLADAAGGEDRRPASPAARAAPRCGSPAREPPELRLVLGGRLLGEEDEERSLADLGLAAGAAVHCVLSAPSAASGGQPLVCYPHRCTVDGGRSVQLLGERFPLSPQTRCRFGTVVVDAKVEADGVQGVAAEVSCTAPPHPAGPVTLSVSFDGGTTWLGGPTFWYVDPSAAGCPHGVPVPAPCAGGAHRVRTAALFGHQATRWDPNDRGPGSGGCA